MELLEWMTTTQVAKYLRVAYMTVKRFEKRGILVPTKRVGKRKDRLYSKKDILTYLGEPGYPQPKIDSF